MNKKLDKLRDEAVGDYLDKKLPFFLKTDEFPVGMKDGFECGSDHMREAHLPLVTFIKSIKEGYGMVHKDKNLCILAGNLLKETGYLDD